MVQVSGEVLLLFLFGGFMRFDKKGYLKGLLYEVFQIDGGSTEFSVRREFGVIT